MDRMNMLQKKMDEGTITDPEREELMSMRSKMQSDSGM